MSDSFYEPILTEEFFQEFMSNLSNAVYSFQCEQPEHETFLEKRTKWNDTLARLGTPMMAQYDNEVLGAFIDYQEILENYSAARGIITTLTKETDDGTEEIPGLDQAAARLNQVCEQFIGQLDDETGLQCAGYLRARKELIDAGSGLCRQCGVELAEHLLEQTGGYSQRT